MPSRSVSFPGQAHHRIVVPEAHAQVAIRDAAVERDRLSPTWPELTLDPSEHRVRRRGHPSLDKLVRATRGDCSRCASVQDGRSHRPPPASPLTDTLRSLPWPPRRPCFSRAPRCGGRLRPVEAPTTFEETVESGSGRRSGWACSRPHARLPPKRELSEQLGKSPLDAAPRNHDADPERPPRLPRGRAGGTFVADAPPLAEAQEAGNRAARCARSSTTGSRSRRAPRCSPPSAPSRRRWRRLLKLAMDFAAYRHADVFFHLGLAEAAESSAAWRR